jgi:glycerophosphoryl diester phosphodiesterase
MNLPFLWAHRGASAIAPENTMAAFSAALECGADGLELDVHLSRDGVPVVIHDDTLARTTNGQGRVNGKTWSQLQMLDAGSWFSATFAGEPVPSLEEVLRTFGGRMQLNLEIKAYDAGAAVLELLQRHPRAACVVSSFDCQLLERLRAADDSLPIAVLFAEGNWRHAVRIASSLRSVAFHPQAEQVNRLMIAACRRVQLPVHAWTVDDIEGARSLLRAGVKGVFTNDPLALRRMAIPATH